MSEKKRKKGGKSLILDLSKGFKWLLFISGVATILSIIFNYLMPQVIRITVDSVIGSEPFSLPKFITDFLTSIGGRDFLRTNLIYCALAAMIFSVLSGIFTFVGRISMAKCSESMVNRLRNRLYAHIEKLPYSWHVENQTGDIIQRCTSDVDVIRNFLAGQVMEMFRTVFLLVISLVLMFSMNVKLSLVVVCFLPIIFLYSGIFFGKIAKKFRIADEAEGDLSAMVQENYTGVRVVRAFGRERYEINKFDEKNTKFSKLWVKLGTLLAYYWGLGDFVSNLQVVTVMVLGIVETVSGAMTVGEFIVFCVYNSMLIWPVRNLGRILSETSKTSVSISRIREILDEKEEHNVDNPQKPDLNGDIVFDNVSFDYNGKCDVLHNVSFTIKNGQTIGILGSTGSGKSTLMYLLDRLYDLPKENGNITINDVDISQIDFEYLRQNVGFVLQEPFLFSKTIKDNIGIVTNNGESLEEIRHAADIAAVDNAIEEFSDGYDTIVGERGVTLSGGQKQRVAIARMLMQKAPIMIFDDSLSAVDAETDAKIRAALQHNTGNSTVILISHRINTLMHCDNIIVMDKGSIVEQGTHKELCEQDGIYKSIYAIQGKSSDDASFFDEDKGGNQ